MLVEYINPSIVSLLVLVFCFYISELTTDYPDIIHDMVEEPLFKLIVILVIFYISTKDFQIGLLLSMIFTIMISNIPLLSETDIVDNFTAGPALSDCSTYEKDTVEEIGTAFYPIN